MKLLINTATTLKGGGLQVAKSFIEECKTHKSHEFHIILGVSLGKTIDKGSFPDNFYFYQIDFRPGTRIFSFNSGTSFFKELESKICPDVVFTTSGPAYWRPKAPHLVGFNLPHYVYPDSPFFKTIPLWKNIRWKIRGLIKSYFLKKEANAFVVQTDDVNSRLKKWLKNDNVFTVSNSCSSYYFKTSTFANKIVERLPNEFLFLFLSAYHPHKNFEILKKVIDYGQKNNTNLKFRFILTLPENIFNSIFEERYRKYINNVGAVPVPECASLYKECDAMFLPTLLECFSASYVEAMYMEKPIVTSNLDFAKTVCGDAALYFDPLNEIEISRKLEMIISDSKLRETLVEKGIAQKVNFKTAKQRAESYIELCKMIRKPSNFK
jgi:glycosyltransferase involved in cell wall biosynthesis